MERALGVGGEPALALGREPDDVRRVHAGLAELVLDVAPDAVVHERGDDRRLEPKAGAQPLGDIGLAAAVPDSGNTRAPGGHLAGVYPHHYLAEGDGIISIPGGLDLKLAHRILQGVQRARSCNLKETSTGRRLLLRSTAGDADRRPAHSAPRGPQCRDYFVFLSAVVRQGCSGASPWHSLICSGVHFFGSFPFSHFSLVFRIGVTSLHHGCRPVLYANFSKAIFAACFPD